MMNMNIGIHNARVFKMIRMLIFARIHTVIWLTAAGIILSACAFPARKSPTAPSAPPPPVQQGEAATHAPVKTKAAPPATPQPPTFTRVPDEVSWQIQSILWGPAYDRVSLPVMDADGSLRLAYIDRYTNNLDLGIFSQNEWKLSRIARDAKDIRYLSLSPGKDTGLQISYYNPKSKVILFGQQGGTGWQLVEALKDVEITALKLVSGPAGEPVLIFRDTSTDTIRYALKTGETWQPADTPVSTGANSPFAAGYGPDQNLHLVASQKGQGLVYLTLSAGGWETLVIDPVGGYPALAFAQNGAPFVSYFEPTEQVLKIASLQNGSWQSSVVDSSPGVGRFSALAVGADGRLHISYADTPRGLLKYASGSGGNWNIWIIDEQRQVEQSTWLGLDVNGNPRIVYPDARGYAVLDASLRLSKPPGQQKLTAVHRYGQTFLTWQERANLRGEVYRVYRSTQSIQYLSDLPKTNLLAEVGEHSSRFYENFHSDGDFWRPRYNENLITADGGLPVPDQTGLLVWTLSSEDLQGKDNGEGYYAVTVTPQNGKETLISGYTTGAVAETLADPRPVEISQTPGMNVDPNRYIYVQFMDLRRWNPTFHAPNPTNNYYGFSPGTPGFASSLQYAYDYTVFAPSAKDCGGEIPEILPVYVFLHGYRGNRYGEITTNPFPFCAYGIYPVDETETWYFGFAQKHDFRLGGEIERGDVIENYTEQRVLRMVYDLLKNPPAQAADEQRVYVFGHSMGGSGALAFAERYPKVFAAAYSGQPITDYRTAGKTDKDWAADVAKKWGAPDLNLPIHISAPANWSKPLQKYEGTGVWDWQDTLQGVARQSADDMAPLGIDHGTKDSVIIWSTQAEPFYPALAASRQPWGGLVNEADHEWSNFAGMLPAVGNSGDVLPFWNLTMIRDETVPGLSQVKPDPVKVQDKGLFYNHTVLWSSSWNPWDGSPVDQPDRWQMSFCAGKPGSSQCGADNPVAVDLTPRRTQNFQAVPGRQYTWKNILISSGAIAASGTVTAGANGLLTVPGFQVSPSGNRLLIEPAGQASPTTRP